MIPQKLDLYNFMSYQSNQTLNFENINLACISGANGVGKSSILEAITWVLWGKSRAGSDDDLIAQGQSNMWVDLTFTSDAKTYRVVRKRSIRGRGSSELYLHQATRQDFENITEETIRKTQEKIEKIIKLPYRIFINSAYLRQGHADEFTSHPPSERKDILAEILDLGYFDQLKEKAKEKLRLTQGKIETLRIQVENAQVEIAQKESLKKEFEFAARKKEKIEKQLLILQKELKNLQHRRDEFHKMGEKMKALRERWFEIKNDISELEEENQNLKKEIENLNQILSRRVEINQKITLIKKLQKDNEKFNDAFNKLAELKDQYADAERKIVEATNQIKIKKSILKSEFAKEKLICLDQVKNIARLTYCPLCRQKVTPAHIKKIRIEMAAKIKNLEKEYRQKLAGISFQKIDTTDADIIKKEITKIDYNKNKHLWLKKELNKLAPYQEQKEILIGAEQKTKNGQESIKKNLGKIAEKEKRQKKVGFLGLELREREEKLEPEVRLYDQTKEKIEIFSSQLLEKQSEYSTQKERYLAAVRLEKEVKNKVQEIKKSSVDVSIFEELVFVFGKKGIQKMVISEAIPEIRDSTNELLGRMSNGEMRIDLTTERKKKGDKEAVIETLDIKISDNAGKRDYELFSGGEAFRINFAIRVALSKLLARRAGSSLKFLVIDEGFGTQDIEGRTHLVAAINSIKDQFEKILIITHLQELKELFDQRIEITKDRAGSHITVNI